MTGLGLPSPVNGAASITRASRPPAAPCPAINDRPGFAKPRERGCLYYESVANARSRCPAINGRPGFAKPRERGCLYYEGVANSRSPVYRTFSPRPVVYGRGVRGCGRAPCPAINDRPGFAKPRERGCLYVESVGNARSPVYRTFRPDRSFTAGACGGACPQRRVRRDTERYQEYEARV
jgi:hypothetical protein